VENDLKSKTSFRRNFFSLKTLLGFVASGLIFFYFLRNFELDKAIGALSEIKIHYFIFAFIVYYLSLPVRGWRWGLLMDKSENRIETKALTHYYFLSWFVNSLLPARIGDIYRAYLLKKNKDVSISYSFGVLFSERIFDLVLISILVIISGVYFGSAVTGTKEGDYLILGFMAVMLLIAFFIAAIAGLPYLTKVLPSKWADRLDRFRTGLFRTPGKIPSVVAATLIVWLSEGLRLYFVLLAFGIEGGLMMAIFISQASLIVMAIPLSPAGLGIVEILILKVLAFSGLDINLAGAIAISDRIISYWSLLVLGGISYLFSTRVR
jgi:uncharacterized protein (TIRG00374 family)